MFLKYELDKSDPENIADDYDIQAYPTFVILDKNGDEYTRVVGGARDAAAFNKKLDDALKYENTPNYYKERFKSDPSTGMAYVKILSDMYMSEEASEVIDDIFETKTIEENFSKTAFNEYKPYINDFDSDIFEFMVYKRNVRKVKKIMGKEEYNSYVTNFADGVVKTIAIGGPRMNVKELDEALEFIDKHPVLRSEFIKFIIANKDVLVEGDGSIFLPNLKEQIMKVDEKSIDMYLNFMYSVNQDAAAKAMWREIMQAAADSAKSVELKRKYEGYLKQMKR